MIALGSVTQERIFELFIGELDIRVLALICFLPWADGQWNSVPRSSLARQRMM
jgi:hypothetical protein